jgi:hypothetical protein
LVMLLNTSMMIMRRVNLRSMYCCPQVEQYGAEISAPQFLQLVVMVLES